MIEMFRKFSKSSVDSSVTLHFISVLLQSLGNVGALKELSLVLHVKILSWSLGLY